MKRQNKSSKKLTLDNQAVRELNLVEIEKADEAVGGSIRTQLIETDAGKC